MRDKANRFRGERLALLQKLLNKSAHCIKKKHIFIDQEWVANGVTDQFLAEASTYHERYFATPYWTYHLGAALKQAGVDLQTSPCVLDVGSGSGNTVLPLLEIMPNSRIIATDISPDLLYILNRIGHEQRLPEGRLECLCFDLHKDFFRPGSFDLIVGGAILHHIKEPAAALENILRWLKHGGCAVLFEPFEYGAHLVCAIFQILIDEARHQTYDPHFVQVLRAIKVDAEHRFGMGRLKPWTAQLDDKWLFTREYLEQVCEIHGCRAEILPMNISQTYFLATLNAYLNVSGYGDVIVPEWAKEIVDLFDRGIAPPIKEKLFTEGTVIIRK